MHLNQPPPAPRSLVPDLPAEVEALVLATLAKKPEARTQTMAEVQAALKGAAEGRKVGVSTPDFGGRTLPIGGGPGREAASTPGPGSGSVPAAPVTTFSTGIGEQVDRPARRRSWIPGVAALAAVVILTGVLLARRSQPPLATPTAAGTIPAQPSAPVPGTPPAVPDPAPAPTPRMVQVVLGSRPSEARVVRASDGTVLGSTPFSGSFPAGGAPIEVRIEKPGFQSASRVLRLERDHQETVPLSPRRPSLPRRKPGSQPGDPEEPAKL